MSKTVSIPKFRVIEGGQPSGKPHTDRSANSTQDGIVLTDREIVTQKIHLQRAILGLTIEELGLSVSDALEEFCEVIDIAENEAFSRGQILNRCFDELGLRIRLGLEGMNLDREAYLALTDPKQLLRRHPELAAFRPQDHVLTTLG